MLISSINLVLRVNYLACNMVKTSFLYSCYHIYLNEFIKLVLRTNYLDLLW